MKSLLSLVIIRRFWRAADSSVSAPLPMKRSTIREFWESGGQILSATRLIAAVAILLLAQLRVACGETVQHITLDPPLTNHQLWLVSTRDASSCPSLEQTSRLRYWRCDPDQQWRHSHLSELLGSDDPNMTTLFYVHENRVTQAETFGRARKVFRQLSDVAPAGQRFRMIALSWPSDRIAGGQRADVQIKAQRSEAHSFYLAWLVDQIRPDVPVSFFGDSFGPRLITAALHRLGGGSIQGQGSFPRLHPQRRPVRAVLMSAALDAHWLYPGQRHGLALTQVEHMLITVNPADRTLRWYPHMDRLLRNGPDALGYVGVPCVRCLGQYEGRVAQWNVCGIVGSTHSWLAYEGSLLMMQQLAPHLFGV